MSVNMLIDYTLFIDYIYTLFEIKKKTTRGLSLTETFYKNIFFYVWYKKEIHTSLEQHEVDVILMQIRERC